MEYRITIIHSNRVVELMARKASNIAALIESYLPELEDGKIERIKIEQQYASATKRVSI